MRILLAVILLAALGWSAYWWLGKSALERSLAAWFEARAAEGWVVHHQGIATTGFPNRFDTTIEGLELADPETGVAWSMPQLRVHALSYRPHHVILVWPETQVFATPREKVTITGADMRGSAVFVPGRALTLDRATIAFDTIGLSSTAGWSAAFAKGQLSLRRTPGAADHRYDIALSARDLTLPSRLARALSQRGLVTDRAQMLTLEATVLFDAPWDRRAIEDRRPQPREIDLALARAAWGRLDLKLAGRLAVAPDGLPEGSLTVKATNWREILSVAESAGAVPAGLAPLLERGLSQLARLSGNPATLDVPLRFEAGVVTLGGLVPLGPAPRLILP